MLSRAFATATLDAQEQRAALRDGLLECGRLIGWPARTTIVFTERLARRPWKRCTRAELSAVLEELLRVLWAFEVRRKTPTAPRCPALANGRARVRERSNGHAPRH
jgi:hypothetical protein